MKRLTIDGFVLRFPRTGIVNHVYNILVELVNRPDFDISVLLEDHNFTDPEIAHFVKCRLNSRVVERIEDIDALGRIKRLIRDRNLAARLARREEVESAVAPGDIYQATDWYHYAVPHARYNLLMYYDLTTRLYSNFHEHTNVVKEKRKEQSLKDFDRIIAISNSTKNDLINHVGVSEEKITTIYLGADRAYDSPRIVSRIDFLPQYNIDHGCRYILSVGTIEPRKNIIGILEAFKALLSEPNYRDVRLVLSGPMGWKNDSLSKYMDEYPYQENIIFTGYVNLHDMPSLYRHAEAFVYLSFYEGFGLPILEAMKSSCPVVCSNTSSMPEVLGECGETVSPHSPDEAAAALARILDDPAYADSLRFSGLVRSRQFTWAKHVERLVEIYNDV
ncbi:MAG: hypothetical protein DCF28_03820 [Alphaproteobacteria bacterium]|nr:MAG: hypothetical protein DCF28_03820 [Alphaproteobacteria bacterium]PZO40275.1 MAG: hypothetical protein DCE92_02615 [Alphaproteobacteria bacterium]